LTIENFVAILTMWCTISLWLKGTKGTLCNSEAVPQL